jgi:hypothetical protein
MQWLAASLVLSVVLTVLVNLALWLFPGMRDRTARGIESYAAHGDRRTRVIVPWKAMLIASLVLTVVINVLLWLGRT